MVTSRDAARIERTMRALAADGAAPVPDGLAARAFAAAIAHPQVTSSFDALVDAILAIARPFALVTTAAALIGVLASALVSSSTTALSTTAIAQGAVDPLRAFSAERFDVDTLVAEHLGMTTQTTRAAATRVQP